MMRPRERLRYSAVKQSAHPVGGEVCDKGAHSVAVDLTDDRAAFVCAGVRAFPLIADSVFPHVLPHHDPRFTGMHDKPTCEWRDLLMIMRTSCHDFHPTAIA